MADDKRKLGDQIDEIVHTSMKFHLPHHFHIPDPLHHHPHIPTPGEIANEIKDAVNKATKPLEAEVDALRTQLGQMQGPLTTVQADATKLKGFLDALSAQLPSLATVEADAKAAAAKVNGVAKGLESRAEPVAKRLGAFAYEAKVDAAKLESLALGSDTVQAMEAHLHRAASMNPTKVVDALYDSVKGDGKGYRDTLRTTLEELVDAAAAVPHAPPVAGASAALDRLESALDLLPDAAFDVLATLMPQSELKDATAKLQALAPKASLQTTTLGARDHVGTVRGLLAASATVSAISLCLKVVPKAIPLKVRVLEEQGIGAEEKGGGGGAAGVRGALGLRISEEVSLVTGVQGPSVTQVAVGAITMLLDIASDVLTYASKHV